MYIPIQVAVIKLSVCVYFCFCLVHVWAINKDLSVQVTEVCGQCWAAPSGPLLDSEGVDYG